MKVIVVAALIKKDGKVLIAKRATGDQNILGKWEFPGGKVEQGESEKDAIEREIWEEFDIRVKAQGYLVNNVCEYPTKIVDLRLYGCEYLSGEYHLHAHSEYQWVTIEELSDYDFALADIPLVKYVKENRN